MYPLDLTGKNAVVFGVANHRSIAWSIAQMLGQAGARLALTYQGERLKEGVTKLADQLAESVVLPCDVSDDEAIQSVFEQLGQCMGQLHVVVHSVAFAAREELQGDFSNTSREGFRAALDISAYSLIPIARYARPLMQEGGAMLTMTFHASERVYPGYNVMGTAKACAGERGQAACRRDGPAQRTSQRFVGGALGYTGSSWHRRIRRYEAGARRAVPSAA